MLTVIIGFILTVMFIEFISMILSYGSDYGDNLLSSLFFALFIFGTGYVVYAIQNDVETNTEQSVALTEQWTENVVDEVTNIITDALKPVEANDVVEADDVSIVEDVSIEILTTNIPTNVAHIDYNRRNYDTPAVYTNGKACVDDKCFNVKLIQHTDGSFWACKRNYGSCYLYE